MEFTKKDIEALKWALRTSMLRGDLADKYQDNIDKIDVYATTLQEEIEKSNRPLNFSEIVEKNTPSLELLTEFANEVFNKWDNAKDWETSGRKVGRVVGIYRDKLKGILHG